LLATDVLALQEVDVGNARSQEADLVDVVVRATGLHGTFGRAATIDGAMYGNALFATAPLTDVETVALPGRREPRAVTVARTAGTTVAVTHLSVGADQHAEQLAFVLDLLDGWPAPRVLLGDFNHEQPDVGRYALAGGGPSWPADAPRRRIDHIATDGLEIEAVEIVKLAVSDHRAVVARLR
jgi:endonuclease/exonuclease/phosphatase family metal-dependent hydrolase